MKKKAWPVFIRLFQIEQSRLKKPHINHKQPLEINLLQVSYQGWVVDYSALALALDSERYWASMLSVCT